MCRLKLKDKGNKYIQIEVDFNRALAYRTIYFQIRELGLNINMSELNQSSESGAAAVPHLVIDSNFTI